MPPVETVLDDRAHDAGGAFGSQREALTIAVGEGPHLLADHVGRLADTPREQGGVFEDRQLDVPVPGQSRGMNQSVAHGDELR